MIRDIDFYKKILIKNKREDILKDFEIIDADDKRMFLTCKTCGLTYKSSYNGVMTNNIKHLRCCNSDKINIYQKRANALSVELVKVFKSENDYLDLYNIEDSVSEYVKTEKFEQLVDIDRLIEMTIEAVKKRLEDKLIGLCSICGEVKKGNSGWDSKYDGWTKKICSSCIREEVFCTTCTKDKKTNRYPTLKQYRFTYLEDKNRYSYICNKCIKEGKEEPELL